MRVQPKLIQESMRPVNQKYQEWLKPSQGKRGKERGGGACAELQSETNTSQVANHQEPTFQTLPIDSNCFERALVSFSKYLNKLGPGGGGGGVERKEWNKETKLQKINNTDASTTVVEQLICGCNTFLWTPISSTGINITACYVIVWWLAKHSTRVPITQNVD